MTTEEIDLNSALEAAGVEVVETDLGEYVIQLAGEKPSHITAPIVHKDLAAVSEIFEKRLGVPRTDDPRVLVEAAREALRDVYRRCDLGITGANFVVAESGSVVIVMNEGNGRFCTSLPPTHVVLAGIEKLVPTLEDLAVFLRLLARSATGQRITTDTLLLTGPRRVGDADGPRSLHVVFLDAGRSRILATDQSSILRCIRCGACLNVCPVYRSIGGHAYGTVYPGPVGKVLAPLLDPDGDLGALPRASTLCRACADVCPVKIDLPELLVSLRASTARLPWLRCQGLRAAALALRSPALYVWLQRAIRGRLRRRARNGWIDSAPWPLAPWTRAERDLRAPPSRSFRDLWREREGGKR
jgi:L-lactate dehydrogenase complex protein LldF